MKTALSQRGSRTDETGLQFLLTHIVEDFMHFLTETGLSRPQIHALLHIYHAGDCRVSEISTLSGSSAAAASQLVERLVRQGLVQRVEDPSNRRIKRLRLSRRALELLKRGMGANRFLGRLMEHLAPGERRLVHTALGHLVRAAALSHSDTRERTNQHA